MVPVREYIRQRKADGTLKGRAGVEEGHVRGLRTEDFFGSGRGRAQPGLGDLDRDEKEETRGSRTEDDEESSSDGTEEGEDRFRDSAYQDAETAPVPVR